MTKITALAEQTVLESTDLFVIVDDVGSTPVTKKSTLATIVSKVLNSLEALSSAVPVLADYFMFEDSGVSKKATITGLAAVVAPDVHQDAKDLSALGTAIPSTDHIYIMDGDVSKPVRREILMAEIGRVRASAGAGNEGGIS